MRNFLIIIFMMLSLASCSVASYVTGDITWMADNGNIVRQWDKALLQTDVTTLNGTSTVSAPIKMGGWFSFKDKENENIMINGGMVIVENIKTQTETVSSNNDKTQHPESKRIYASYEAKMEEISAIKAMIKSADNEKKREYKAKLSNLKQEAESLKREYFMKTGKQIN